ncbi:hypothetical protein [Cardinium endosymbiont of Tipula unca]|uniref:hypothetical protein n=1 Tax=Cardinium endosymbiont of Tipula unca TaxID=3066216 RepID=UPI0030D43621
MYFNKSFYSIALLLLLQLASCSTKPANSNAQSVESQIGVFSLDNTQSYAEKLDPEVRDVFMGLLKGTSLQRLLIEKKGIDPNNSDLSPKQEKALDALNLIFIDLCRVIYKAFEPVLSKQFDENQKEGNNQDGPPTKQLFIAAESFRKMRMGFAAIIEDPAKYSADQPELYEAYIIPLAKTVQKYYIDPYTQYLDSGEFNTLQDFVGIGRKKVYRIVAEYAKGLYK